MADDKNKPSIFTKMLEVGNSLLDAQIHKAKTSIVMNQDNIEDEFYFSKTITEDPSYAINASGWKEKPYRLMDGHLKNISLKNSAVAAIIQTRQNQVSNHSKLVKSEKEKGWMLCLRDEEALLEKIKAEIEAENAQGQMNEMTGDEESQVDENPATDDQSPMAKAEGDALANDQNNDPNDKSPDSESFDSDDINAKSGSDKSDDDVEGYNWELERKAREKLEAQFKDAKKKVQDFILNCGVAENRTFADKKWNFDLALRAWVRDSLTYDRYCTEVVPDKAGRVHHWFPVDAGTIKYSSLELKNYKEVAQNFLNLDLLYPEKDVQDMEKQKVLDLDPDLLAENEYKYVQVIRGKIERAYTPDEMKMGIRNLTTDIYNNGYGVSELELMIALVTGHLNAEFYNQAYFTQGFSAKGILHIKAAIPRRKLESIRQQWQHMLKGSRNSFQTPIFAGLDDVEWIPLTQNHDDIGFEGWMRYLIKMICAIYQIDPYEIGIGFKDEGGAGSGGMSGNNTKEKIEHSKDKGLYPLMRHLENYINEEIVRPFDARFVLKFTGISNESQTESLERQEKEVKFKKTVNEIRAEDGLPPLPGMDDVILDAQYMAWYASFSEKGQELQKQAADAASKQAQSQFGGGSDQGGGDEEEEDPFNKDPNSVMSDDNLSNNMTSPEEDDFDVTKSRKPGKSKKARKVKVDYYTLKD